MKISFVSVEVAPFAKVGGLADVAGSLPKQLLSMGHDVRIVMPAYQMVLDQFPCEKLCEFRVEISSGWAKWATVYRTMLDEVPVYLIGTDEWFTEAVSSDTVYRPGYEQYIFFSKAILELGEEDNWIPDVVHANDWHTGLLPVIIREQGGARWAKTGCLFTIHNLAYQGEFGVEVLDRSGLPRSLFNMHQLETYGALNFLKAGCVFSDHVNTVSPSYALEIQTAQYGCRLEGLMKHLADYGRLSGIVNGLDDEWSPVHADDLASPFSSSDLSGKHACKMSLLHELGLPELPNVPMAGVVSRLSEQKGMHMILDAAEELALLPIQMVVQGLGDPWLAARFTQLEKRYPDHFRFVQKFDAGLARRIYAGSDMFLMPSMFEPCGLGQLIAMRFGTVPIVRQTGGLADTVFDGDNGFVFQETSAEAFYQAVQRAHKSYTAADWQPTVQRCMGHDSSWVKSGSDYVKIYEHILHKRTSKQAAQGQPNRPEI